MPRLEHHEAPELVLPRRDAAPVLLEKSLHGPAIEVAALSHPAIHQQVSAQFPQVFPEPRLERNAETFSRAIDDVGWNKIAHCPLEDVLRGRATEFQIGR